MPRIHITPTNCLCFDKFYQAVPSSSSKFPQFGFWTSNTGEGWTKVILNLHVHGMHKVLFTNIICINGVFSSLQSLSRVQLFATPWTAAHQASLSITNSWSPSKPMSIELVMPSNHLTLCHPLLLLPSIFPNIRVFSNESVLRSGGQNIYTNKQKGHIHFLKMMFFSFT